MQKRNTQLTMKDIDASMVFSIIAGVVVAIIAVPFLFVWAMVMNSSRSNGANHPRNDELAMKHAIAAEIKETQFIHDNYKMNGTIVQGPKDPEW